MLRVDIVNLRRRAEPDDWTWQTIILDKPGEGQVKQIHQTTTRLGLDGKDYKNFYYLGDYTFLTFSVTERSGIL